MKLDANALRYLSKEEMRVLTAVELGMKNHEYVPLQLIDSLAKLKRGGTHKGISELHKHKLVFHTSTPCK